MGKVGSISIFYNLLDRNLGVPVHHCHALHDLDRLEESMKEALPNPDEELQGGTLAGIRRYKEIRDELLAGPKPWNIITLTRDPVPRNISAFFQSAPERIPDFYERLEAGTLSLDELEAAFLMDEVSHNSPLVWFDEQLKPFTGIDVFERPFPHEKGYDIFESDRARLLVIRLEDYFRCGKQAFLDFLGLEDWNVQRKGNTGETKTYGTAYKKFLGDVTLPDTYLDRMYDSKYAKHFYTETERRKFRTSFQKRVSIISEAEKKSGETAIIMRTKDRPLLLKRALESVANQETQDWVLSIVNDGGDPCPVEELVASFGSSFQSRVNITHHPRSRGMEAASNAGIHAVRSKYCVIHDDDDAWSPRFLSATTGYFKTERKWLKIKGVVTNTVRVMERIEADNVIEESRHPWQFDNVNLTLANMCLKNSFAPIAFMYMREVYDQIGYYDESLPVLGDWDFNVRFLRHFDLQRIPEALAYYHLRSSASGGSYLGTVNHQTGLHREYRVYLQNKYLRDDLDKGRVGVGFLMSLNDATSFPGDIRNAVLGSHAILVRFNEIKAKASAIGAKNPLLKGVVRRIRGKA